MAKTIVWRKSDLQAEEAKILSDYLIALGMPFNVVVQENLCNTRYMIVVSFDIPEPPKGVVGSSPGFMYEFKRRADGYMETAYPLHGDFDYAVELNGKVVEWGHTFESAREAMCRLIGEVKILARKREDK